MSSLDVQHKSWVPESTCKKRFQGQESRDF